MGEAHDKWSPMINEELFAPTAYRFLEFLGKGSMGTVFLVEHRTTLRRCVAKVIHPHLSYDSRSLDRVRLEAQVLGRLSHPHIVKVLPSGKTSDGRPFIAMEYLKGESLSQRLKKGELGLELSLSYARQFLSALEAAHSAGIIHRDLKPGNLFVARESDGTELIKVLDFGLAKIAPDASRSTPTPLVDPTTAGTAIGTPRYMSPEAASGQQVDERADVYASGLILYRMLAGRGPFEPGETGEPMSSRLREKPHPPSHWLQSPIPADLDRIVLHALSMHPEDRFASAKEFRLALDFGISELVVPEAEQQGQRKGQSASSPWFFFFAMLVVGVLIGLILSQM